MGRTDYYRDPDAPAPNLLVPGASAIVTDEAGRLVLHRRSDNGLWALPGGDMELGESVAGTVVREVKEETGLDVEPWYVVGVYSDPEHVFAYDDGHVRQEYSVCVACRLIGGELAISDESTELGVFTAEEVEGLAMHERIRVRIRDFLAGERGAVH
ncbi:NUDIX domain-containing protein [Rugosimonospora africana]|uniref:Putative MutT/NUDIX-like protein n=1 Tax=Rugosimonospora africana TaxID=556532 RepID=A0A8J3VU34_9ACTN|nr:NUDIX domain-containing protein [Rugosimonospora africana]GIH18805.1 putative MutT/NUDIX-like protein [Rugosimonospora africana]